MTRARLCGVTTCLCLASACMLTHVTVLALPAPAGDAAVRRVAAVSRRALKAAIEVADDNIDIDGEATPCAGDNPCSNDGECFLSSAASGYKCECGAGFAGSTCSEAEGSDVTPAAAVPADARSKAASTSKKKQQNKSKAELKAEVARLRAALSAAVAALSASDASTDGDGDAAGAPVEYPGIARVVPRKIIGDITNKTFPLNPGAKLARGVTCAGTSYDIFVHDPKLCRFISKSLLQGSWECHIITQVLEIMNRAPDGDRGYFMDIGANIGSLSMAVAHSGFRVVSFEAMTLNIELQQASIGTYGLEKNTWLFHSGVGAEAGGPLCVRAALLGYPSENVGNGQLVKPKDNSCAEDHERVPVRTIDSILASVPVLKEACYTVVKADVEGYEALAFAGALGVFTGPCPPCVVLLEYTEAYVVMATPDDKNAPFTFLKKHNYDCAKLGGADWKCTLKSPAQQARCSGKGGQILTPPKPAPGVFSLAQATVPR